VKVLLLLVPLASLSVSPLLGQSPTLRTTIIGLPVAATVGSGGVHVSVGGARIGRAPARAPARTPAGAPAAASASARRVLATAGRYVGIRYVYGGARPATGFDCSGFVQYVFARHGVRLPRTSRQQAGAGRAVPVRGSARITSLRVGDLLFFNAGGRRIDHVAVYAGDGRIIHSSSSGGGVRWDRLDSRRGRWFLSRHVATRRVLSNGGRLTAALAAR